MADKMNIPKEKFAFVNAGERLSDEKFSDKPIGYMRDAWIRFRKNKASVVAAIIILCIVLYSFVMPLLITSHDKTLSVTTYQKKPSRVTWLRDFGIATGGVDENLNEGTYIRYVGIAVAADGKDGQYPTLGEALKSEQSVL